MLPYYSSLARRNQPIKVNILARKLLLVSQLTVLNLPRKLILMGMEIKLFITLIANYKTFPKVLK